MAAPRGQTSVVVAAIAATATATGRQDPRISEAVLKAAIDAYAPVLVCHQHERYLPTCVESYLLITEPFTYVDRHSKKQYVGLRHRPLSNPANLEQQAKQRGGDPDNAKTYVNVKVGAKTTEIQYWFLYAYNGAGIAYLKRLTSKLRYEPLGKGSDGLGPGDYDLGELGVHEGDWEHVTVTIDNVTGQITSENGLYIATHAEGVCHNISQQCMVRVHDEPRIQVYASRNGHATYLHMARSYHETVKAGLIEFRLLNDTTLPGLAVDFRHRCEIIGIHGDVALKRSWNGTAKGFVEPSYVTNFPGRWGRVVEKPHPYAEVLVVNRISEALLKAAGVYDELTFEAGPYPPWSKCSWTGPE